MRAGISYLIHQTSRCTIQDFTELRISSIMDPIDSGRGSNREMTVFLSMERQFAAS